MKRKPFFYAGSLLMLAVLFIVSGKIVGATGQILPGAYLALLGLSVHAGGIRAMHKRQNLHIGNKVPVGKMLFYGLLGLFGFGIVAMQMGSKERTA